MPRIIVSKESTMPMIDVHLPEAVIPAEFAALRGA